MVLLASTYDQSKFFRAEDLQEEKTPEDQRRDGRDGRPRR